MNDSHAPTRLRVLSGQHAGVFIDWSSSRLHVGANEELDVFIGDWNAQQIELQRDGEGRCLARWAAADDNLAVAGEKRDGDGLQCTLEPWLPVCFGAIILCIGPAQDGWPDDAQLLQRCFAPPPEPDLEPDPEPEPARLRRRPRARKLTMFAMAASCATIAASSAVHRTGPAAFVAPLSAETHEPAEVHAIAAPEPARPEPIVRLRHHLGPQAAEDLALEAIGPRVIVRGVLPTRTAVDRLNAQLDALPSDLPVSRRFIAVPDAIDRLHESLPDGSLTVRHAGGRRFEVSGRVAQLQRVAAAVQHIAADLSEFGLQVESALEPQYGGMPPMSGMLVDSQGTSFLRTRDGVKHIVPGAGAGATQSAPGAPLPGKPSAPQAQETRDDTR